MKRLSPSPLSAQMCPWCSSVMRWAMDRPDRSCRPAPGRVGPIESLKNILLFRFREAARDC